MLRKYNTQTSQIKETLKDSQWFPCKIQVSNGEENGKESKTVKKLKLKQIKKGI